MFFCWKDIKWDCFNPEQQNGLQLSESWFRLLFDPHLKKKMVLMKGSTFSRPPIFCPKRNVTIWSTSKNPSPPFRISFMINKVHCMHCVNKKKMEKKKIGLVGNVLLDGKIFVSVGKIYCCCKVKSDKCPGCSVEMCRVIHNFRTHVNVQIGHTRVRRSTHWLRKVRWTSE